MSRERNYRRLAVVLALTFTLTISSFIAARIVSESMVRGTRQAADLIEHTLPDLEHLTRTRTELAKMEATLAAVTERDVSKLDVDQLDSDLRRSRAAMDREWRLYVSLPILPGEPELIRAATDNIDAMDASVSRALAAVRSGDSAGAVREISARTLPVMGALDDGVQAASDLNRRLATDAAVRITTLRDESRFWGIILDSLSVVLALVAAYVVIRVVRRFWSLLGDRLAELEHFAGRVAHDIRSPLGTVTLTIDLAKRQPEVSLTTQAILERGARTLQRVAQIVDGLLVFAVAGRPPPESQVVRSNVREVLEGIVEDARRLADEKGILIDYVPPNAAMLVSCSPGVLVSMASNFVTNAIKYIGDAPIKRIMICARDVGRAVRVEVSDTGPGIVPELRMRLFDPYVRGADSTIPGLGLGLATVRRLAEAHGGCVGVQANPEGGSLFWFELPKSARVVSGSLLSRSAEHARAH
jgi:signal transduction histidine kinase